MLKKMNIVCKWQSIFYFCIACKERWESGLIHQFAKLTYLQWVPGVRIPPSPQKRYKKLVSLKTIVTFASLLGKNRLQLTGIKFRGAAQPGLRPGRSQVLKQLRFNIRGVAQSGQRTCFGSRGSQVRILPPRH